MEGSSDMVDQIKRIVGDRPRGFNSDAHCHAMLKPRILSLTPLRSMDSSHSKPLVRWFGTIHDNSDKAASASPNSSQPTTPVSTTSNTNASAASSPPSPTLHSLKEALNETMVPHIQTPPQAKLPEHFQPSRPLSRPPTLMLPSATMPTASLARNTRTPSPLDPDNSPPIDTSLDSLRRVSKEYHLQQTRNMSTSSKASASADSPVTNSSSGWWFFNSENKENVDTILGEEDRADTVSQEQENIRKRYRSPKNPVVFCHGLLGFDSVSIGLAIAPVEVSHWRGIKEVLEANGTEVLITRVPATSSPIDRAKVLEERISEVYPGRSVHLIGHSMGGLDCRYLTTHLTKRKFDVLSITTIATPHRGSSFADHFLSTLGQDRMPSFLQLLDFLPNGGGDGKAFESLTIESMRQFNKDVPNVEGVKYFSWGSVYEPGFIDTWKWPHGVIKEKEGPNDGLVSVYSARWGTYLGTLQGVNHLDLVGWINTARYRWAAMMGKEIKFRPATFYLGIADMLAKEVEGQDEIDGGSDGGGSPGGVPSGGNKSGEIADRQTHRESTRMSNVATPPLPPPSPATSSRPQTPRQTLSERLSAAVQASPASDTRTLP